MDVLIAIKSLSPGGGEINAVAQANALAERGMTVTICAAPGALHQRISPQVRWLPIPDLRLSTAASVTMTLVGVIKNVNPAIIHIHGATLAVLAGIAAKQAHSQAPRIMTHHSMGFKKAPRFIASFLIRRYCDHLVAISRAKQTELQGAAGAALQVSLIPNFVDLNYIEGAVSGSIPSITRQELGIPTDAKVAVIAARLVPEKCVDQFIKALAECSLRYEGKVVGLVIGDGPMRDKLKQQADQISDLVQIHFMGYQSEIFSFLACSDIVVFPSKEEVLPTFLLEALAAGVPVVCSDIPGNLEIITHSEDGFIVARHESYAPAVLRLLSDDALANATTENGRLKVKQLFDIEPITQAIIQMYDDLQGRMKKSV